MKDTIVNQLPETSLQTSDFYYHLPEELIAQHPMEKRDASRMMVLDREAGTLSHQHFFDIIDYLNENDVLVINDSKVIPARVYGHVEGREEALIELLLLRQRELDTWECLVKPGKRARIGMQLVFGDGILHAEVRDIVEEGNRLIHFTYDQGVYANIYDVLEKIGLMPLPPVIRKRILSPNIFSLISANAFFDSVLPKTGLLLATRSALLNFL